MALNQKQKDLLDAWSKTQANWSNGQVDGSTASDLTLGTMLANGKVLDDVYRDELCYTAFTLPAPSGTAVSIDVPLIVAPTGGQVVSMNLMVPNGISNTSTTASSYNFSLYRLNNTATALNLAVPTLTGVTASTQLRMPTGSNNVLLTTTTYSITAVASVLNLNCATVTATWVTQPNVGDYIIIQNTPSQFLGSNAANVGTYLITSASTSSLTATKLNAVTNPANVAAGVAIAGDVSTIRLIKVTESTFVNGDMLAIRASVPAASGAVNVTTQYQVQLRMRYSF